MSFCPVAFFLVAFRPVALIIVLFCDISFKSYFVLRRFAGVAFCTVAFCPSSVLFCNNFLGGIFFHGILFQNALRVSFFILDFSTHARAELCPRRLQIEKVH